MRRASTPSETPCTKGAADSSPQVFSCDASPNSSSAFSIASASLSVSSALDASAGVPRSSLAEEGASSLRSLSPPESSSEQASSAASSDDAAEAAAALRTPEKGGKTSEPGSKRGRRPPGRTEQEGDLWTPSSSSDARRALRRGSSCRSEQDDGGGHTQSAQENAASVSSSLASADFSSQQEVTGGAHNNGHARSRRASLGERNSSSASEPTPSPASSGGSASLSGSASASSLPSRRVSATLRAARAASGGVSSGGTGAPNAVAEPQAPEPGASKGLKGRKGPGEEETLERVEIVPGSVERESERKTEKERGDGASGADDKACTEGSNEVANQSGAKESQRTAAREQKEGGTGGGALAEKERDRRRTADAASSSAPVSREKEGTRVREESVRMEKELVAAKRSVRSRVALSRSRHRAEEPRWDEEDESEPEMTLGSRAGGAKASGVQTDEEKGDAGRPRRGRERESRAEKFGEDEEGGVEMGQKEEPREQGEQQETPETAEKAERSQRGERGAGVAKSAAKEPEILRGAKTDVYRENKDTTRTKPQALCVSKQIAEDERKRPEAAKNDAEGAEDASLKAEQDRLDDDAGGEEKRRGKKRDARKKKASAVGAKKREEDARDDEEAGSAEQERAQGELRREGVEPDAKEGGQRSREEKKAVKRPPAESGGDAPEGETDRQEGGAGRGAAPQEEITEQPPTKRGSGASLQGDELAPEPRGQLGDSNGRPGSPRVSKKGSESFAERAATEDGSRGPKDDVERGKKEEEPDAAPEAGDRGHLKSEDARPGGHSEGLTEREVDPNEGWRETRAAEAKGAEGAKRAAAEGEQTEAAAAAEAVASADDALRAQDAPRGSDGDGSSCGEEPGEQPSEAPASSERTRTAAAGSSTSQASSSAGSSSISSPPQSPSSSFASAGGASSSRWSVFGTRSSSRIAAKSAAVRGRDTMARRSSRGDLERREPQREGEKQQGSDAAEPEDVAGEKDDARDPQTGLDAGSGAAAVAAQSDGLESREKGELHSQRKGLASQDRQHPARQEDAKAEVDGRGEDKEAHIIGAKGQDLRGESTLLGSPVASPLPSSQQKLAATTDNASPAGGKSSSRKGTTPAASEDPLAASSAVASPAHEPSDAGGAPRAVSPLARHPKVAAAGARPKRGAAAGRGSAPKFAREGRDEDLPARAEAPSVEGERDASRESDAARGPVERDRPVAASSLASRRPALSPAVLAHNSVVASPTPDAPSDDASSLIVSSSSSSSSSSASSREAAPARRSARQQLRHAASSGQAKPGGDGVSEAVLETLQPRSRKGSADQAPRPEAAADAAVSAAPSPALPGDAAAASDAAAAGAAEGTAAAAEASAAALAGVSPTGEARKLSLLGVGGIANSPYWSRPSTRSGGAGSGSRHPGAAAGGAEKAKEGSKGDAAPAKQSSGAAAAASPLASRSRLREARGEDSCSPRATKAEEKDEQEAEESRKGAEDAKDRTGKEAKDSIARETEGREGGCERPAGPKGSAAHVRGSGSGRFRTRTLRRENDEEKKKELARDSREESEEAKPRREEDAATADASVCGKKRKEFLPTRGSQSLERSHRAAEAMAAVAAGAAAAARERRQQGCSAAFAGGRPTQPRADQEGDNEPAEEGDERELSFFRLESRQSGAAGLLGFSSTSSSRESSLETEDAGLRRRGSFLAPLQRDDRAKGSGEMRETRAASRARRAGSASAAPEAEAEAKDREEDAGKREKAEEKRENEGGDGRGSGEWLGRRRRHRGEEEEADEDWSRSGMQGGGYLPSGRRCRMRRTSPFSSPLTRQRPGGPRGTEGGDGGREDEAREDGCLPKIAREERDGKLESKENRQGEEGEDASLAPAGGIGLRGASAKRGPGGSLKETREEEAEKKEEPNEEGSEGGEKYGAATTATGMCMRSSRKLPAFKRRTSTHACEAASSLPSCSSDARETGVERGEESAAEEEEEDENREGDGGEKANRSDLAVAPASLRVSLRQKLRQEGRRDEAPLPPPAGPRLSRLDKRAESRDPDAGGGADAGATRDRREELEKDADAKEREAGAGKALEKRSEESDEGLRPAGARDADAATEGQERDDGDDELPPRRRVKREVDRRGAPAGERSHDEERRREPRSREGNEDGSSRRAATRHATARASASPKSEDLELPGRKALDGKTEETGSTGGELTAFKAVIAKLVAFNEADKGEKSAEEEIKPRSMRGRGGGADGGSVSSVRLHVGRYPQWYAGPCPAFEPRHNQLCWWRFRVQAKYQPGRVVMDFDEEIRCGRLTEAVKQQLFMTCVRRSHGTSAAQSLICRSNTDETGAPSEPAHIGDIVIVQNLEDLKFSVCNWKVTKPLAFPAGELQGRLERASGSALGVLNSLTRAKKFLQIREKYSGLQFGSVESLEKQLLDILAREHLKPTLDIVAHLQQVDVGHVLQTYTSMPPGWDWAAYQQEHDRLVAQRKRGKGEAALLSAAGASASSCAFSPFEEESACSESGSSSSGHSTSVLLHPPSSCSPHMFGSFSSFSLGAKTAAPRGSLASSDALSASVASSLRRDEKRSLSQASSLFPSFASSPGGGARRVVYAATPPHIAAARAGAEFGALSGQPTFQAIPVLSSLSASLSASSLLDDDSLALIADLPPNHPLFLDLVHRGKEAGAGQAPAGAAQGDDAVVGRLPGFSGQWVKMLNQLILKRQELLELLRPVPLDLLHNPTHLFGPLPALLPPEIVLHVAVVSGDAAAACHLLTANLYLARLADNVAIRTLDPAQKRVRVLSVSSDEGGGGKACRAQPLSLARLRGSSPAGLREDEARRRKKIKKKIRDRSRDADGESANRASGRPSKKRKRDPNEPPKRRGRPPNRIRFAMTGGAPPPAPPAPKAASPASPSSLRRSLLLPSASLGSVSPVERAARAVSYEMGHSITFSVGLTYGRLFRPSLSSRLSLGRKLRERRRGRATERREGEGGGNGADGEKSDDAGEDGEGDESERERMRALEVRTRAKRKFDRKIACAPWVGCCPRRNAELAAALLLRKNSKDLAPFSQAPATRAEGDCGEGGDSAAIATRDAPTAAAASGEAEVRQEEAPQSDPPAAKRGAERPKGDAENGDTAEVAEVERNTDKGCEKQRGEGGEGGGRSPGRKGGERETGDVEKAQAGGEAEGDRSEDARNLKSACEEAQSPQSAQRKHVEKDSTRRRENMPSDSPRPREGGEAAPAPSAVSSSAPSQEGEEALVNGGVRSEEDRRSGREKDKRKKMRRGDDRGLREKKKTKQTTLLACWGRVSALGKNERGDRAMVEEEAKNEGAHKASYVCDSEPDQAGGGETADAKEIAEAKEVCEAKESGADSDGAVSAGDRQSSAIFFSPLSSYSAADAQEPDDRALLPPPLALGGEEEDEGGASGASAGASVEAREGEDGSCAPVDSRKRARHEGEELERGGKVSKATPSSREDSREGAGDARERERLRESGGAATEGKMRDGEGQAGGGVQAPDGPQATGKGENERAPLASSSPFFLAGNDPFSESETDLQAAMRLSVSDFEDEEEEERGEEGSDAKKGDAPAGGAAQEKAQRSPSRPAADVQGDAKQVLVKKEIRGEVAAEAAGDGKRKARSGGEDALGKQVVEKENTADRLLSARASCLRGERDKRAALGGSPRKARGGKLRDAEGDDAQRAQSEARRKEEEALAEASALFPFCHPGPYEGVNLSLLCLHTSCDDEDFLLRVALEKVSSTSPPLQELERCFITHGERFDLHWLDRRLGNTQALQKIQPRLVRLLTSYRTRMLLASSLALSAQSAPPSSSAPLSSSPEVALFAAAASSASCPCHGTPGFEKEIAGLKTRQEVGAVMLREALALFAAERSRLTRERRAANAKEAAEEVRRGGEDRGTHGRRKALEPRGVVEKKPREKENAENSGGAALSSWLPPPAVLLSRQQPSYDWQIEAIAALPEREVPAADRGDKAPGDRAAAEKFKEKVLPVEFEALFQTLHLLARQKLAAATKKTTAQGAEKRKGTGARNSAEAAKETEDAREDVTGKQPKAEESREPLEEERQRDRRGRGDEHEDVEQARRRTESAGAGASASPRSANAGSLRKAGTASGDGREKDGAGKKQGREREKREEARNADGEENRLKREKELRVREAMVHDEIREIDEWKQIFLELLSMQQGTPKNPHILPSPPADTIFPHD
ncbi:hypothetical protein BESB_070560 [Besnoitia besnoiti]|uniref:Uncharacterized protein n=1 Tax=Besnoitia besnoiti TaxID=94643 RepID=A0A2A9M9L7_BESBE|nr:uncharacterized protein BESB_070560 [Besnoitia besnoiti]PFH33904.1 hypothetical protein BESB_070560 [Besnoitia besnoiti]